MERVLMTKDAVATVGGLIGGVVAMAFGGWSEGLTTLVVMMAVDYFSGTVVAGLSNIAQNGIWRSGKPCWLERSGQKSGDSADRGDCASN